ncbi:DUF6461 domain-containing protein [Spirillospora sp. NPDC047418]
MNVSEKEWRELRRAAIRDYHGRIRAWAEQNGLPLNSRGRIPTAFHEKYLQATDDDITDILAEIGRLRPPRTPTAYDYLTGPEWQHFLGAASFSLVWVHGIDTSECLRKLTWLHPVPGGPAPLGDVMSRAEPPSGDITGAVEIGEWTLLYMPNYGGSAAASVAERLSGDDHQAVAYWQIAAIGRVRFLYWRGGELLTEFDPMFPNDRQGSQPHLLVPQMTDTGLLPVDDPDDWPRDHALKALDLADRITGGAHAGPEVIGGTFLWAAPRQAPTERPRDSRNPTMKTLPQSLAAQLVRTDFSDDRAWAAVRATIETPNEDGFRAYAGVIDDLAYRDLTTEEVLGLVPPDSRNPFLAIVDRATIESPEMPILVIDLRGERGEIRVIATEFWGIENNLSLANMDFHEFADAVDPDGVFRGF